MTDNIINDNNKKLTILLSNTTEERKTTNPFVEFEQDDIVVEQKISLGSFLSKQTTNPINNQTYTVGNNNSVTEVPLKDATGYPVTIVTDDNNLLNKTFFNSTMIGLDGEKAKTRFDQNSNSQLFNFGENNGEGFTLIKGKQNIPRDDKQLTLEDLIRKENAKEQIVGKAIAVRQEQTGRFSSDNLYIDPNNTQTENSSGVSSFIIQKKLGSHFPNASFLVGDSSISNNGEADEITIDQLKNIGIQMMIKASGEAYKPKDETDSKYASMLGRTLVPSLGRLGQRVNYSDFSAGKIMEEVNPNYSKPSNPTLTDGDQKQKKSFGSPYNPFVPFNGFLSDASSVVAASAMALGITTVVLSVAKMFNTEKIQNSIRGSNTNSSNSTYQPHINLLGVSSNSSKIPKQIDQGPGNLIAGIVGDRENILGLVSTKFDYYECVKKGLDTYFNPTNKDSRNIVLTSPNFANTILRTITRDLVDLGFNFASLGKDTRNLQGTLEVESANNRDPQNVATTVDATFRMITEIRDNRIIKFINILAILGEKVLEGEKTESYVDLQINDSNNEATFGSNVNLSSFHKKNRLSSNVDKNAGNLSWGSNTIKSMYIKPKEIGIASQLYLNNLNVISNLSERNYFKESDSNRLSNEYVESLESELDTSYMPFYFHDLRTNEIISFHAFLSSISDGYRADYETTEAYGRLGKIYKWKNTTRDDISLEFYIIATNPQDFDEMWLKINKLTMLAHPQYTEGRTVEYTPTTTNGEVTTTHRFVQPFSQIPASSPMIRMRLGDVFKTNFTKIDLARIFGAGNANQFQIGTINQEAQTNIGTNADNNGNSYNIVKNIYKYINNGFVQNDNNQINTQNLQLELLQEFMSFGTNINGKTIYVPTSYVQNDKQDVPNNTNMLYKPAGTIINASTIEASSEVPGAVKIGNEYYVHNGLASALFKPTQTYIQNTINQQISNNNNSIGEQSDYNLVSNFFNTNTNAIFKAFESTKGEGIAGFIQSIKYNFEEGFIWNLEKGKKAPTVVKVSVDFAPIYDLNPGLDSNGFMIGALYNVGSIMNSIKNKETDTVSSTPTTT